MADSQFFTDLAKLDPLIAKHWKKATGDKPKAVLNAAAVEEMFVALVDTGKITESQSKALLYLLKNAKFDKQALEDFRGFIFVASERGLFTLGAGVKLLKPDEIKGVGDALGMGSVGKINFTSPKTGVTYSPNHYQVIRKLLDSSEIWVVEVRVGGLSKETAMVGASYHSDLNRLTVLDGLAPIVRIANIVHEATHSIQDWLDIDREHKFVEADAWIAGGVAARTGGEKALKDYVGAAGWTTVAAASQMIFDAATKDFGTAYEAVWKEMEKSIDKPNARFEPTDKEKGANEKARFDILMAEVTKKKPG